MCCLSYGSFFFFSVNIPTTAFISGARTGGVGAQRLLSAPKFFSIGMLMALSRLVLLHGWRGVAVAMPSVVSESLLVASAVTLFASFCHWFSLSFSQSFLLENCVDFLNSFRFVMWACPIAMSK
jgi:hypothetical protein